MIRSPYKAADEKRLMTEIWAPAISEDPYAFVMFSFPWGKPGTPLEKFSGPRKWQREELMAIRDHIAENRVRMAAGLEPLVYQMATASGRGIGKSSLVAWLILWMMSCHLGSTTIVTANTEAQLQSKTWGELGKWHTLSINSHWFERTALSLRPAPWFAESLETQLKIDKTYYYANATLWSEENPDAFAGAHNMAGMLVIMDEASGIPSIIWSVTEGVFTEPVLHRYWVVFSNPRRNTGAFFECFHKMRAFWRRRNVDGRDVEGTDKNVFAQIIAKYGEDSDEARIEVKGQFPRQGDRQFISRELVEAARERTLEPDHWAALIMGVDPARYGGDEAVIRFRQGRDARTIPAVKRKGLSTMQLANLCADLINQHNPDAVCIDTGGAGAGVFDRLKELRYKVFEVGFGNKAEKDRYANRRAEIWGDMKEWLSIGCIDGDADLSDDLTGPEYHINNRDQTQLESKDEMKARGLSSPDDGDALACTFAVRVARRDLRASRSGPSGRSRVARGVDFDPLGG